MALATSFKELRVWQNAMDLTMRIFELTRSFPREEKYGLADQIRRSSRSVPANVAEGWRKRRYVAAFVSKLNDAEAEAAETQTHIEVARRSGYWDDATAADLDRRCEEVLGQLVHMIEDAGHWCLPTLPRRGQTGAKNDIVS